jgi:hypothetical protein
MSSKRPSSAGAGTSRPVAPSSSLSSATVNASARSSASLPPDVLFAQKASAVVQSAGYDPRTMDLDLFLSVCSDVFVNAHRAIYKELIPGLISDAITDDEKAHNVQILIQVGTAACEITFQLFHH